MPAPRPRHRTPSGHDIPIPEAVWQGMAVLQQENQATRAEVAEVRGDIKEIKASVATIVTNNDARKSQTMIDMAKILVPAVVAIIGGQRLLAPSPEPARVEVHSTPVDKRMAECLPLQPGTAAQSECFARVQAEIQSGVRRDDAPKP